jgi:hypothetical protein
MSKINLSQIENRSLMTVNDIVNHCLDNNIDTIINDFGVGMEFELDDLYQVWEDIKNL